MMLDSLAIDDAPIPITPPPAPLTAAESAAINSHPRTMCEIPPRFVARETFMALAEYVALGNADCTIAAVDGRCILTLHGEPLWLYGAKEHCTYAARLPKAVTA